MPILWGSMPILLGQYTHNFWSGKTLQKFTKHVMGVMPTTFEQCARLHLQPNVWAVCPHVYIYNPTFEQYARVSVSESQSLRVSGWEAGKLRGWEAERLRGWGAVLGSMPILFGQYAQNFLVSIPKTYAYTIQLRSTQDVRRMNPQTLRIF